MLKLLKFRSRSISKLLNIRVKLFIGLLVPVVLLGIYGLQSYRMSQSAIIRTYEINSAGTLNTIRDFLGFGLQSVEEKAQEIISNPEVRVYYNRSGSEDPLGALNQQYTIQSSIGLALETNSFIAGIHLLGANGKGISTATGPSDTLYSAFMDSPEGILIDGSETDYVWTGSHTGLDGQLAGGKEAYGTERYALAMIKEMSQNKGYVVIDISMQQVLDILAKYSLGEGSIVGLINNDGREILTGTGEASVFTGLSYYTDAMKGAQENGKSYDDYNGEQYLFLYSKVTGTNAAVCALIPKATIIDQVKDIRTLNVSFVTIACIFAVLMIIFIAGGVSRAISALMKSISRASKGDLTALFEMKSHDEFRILHNGISDMMESMRKLIGEVQEVGSQVSTSAAHLSDTSEELLTATEDISHTIDDIQNGVVQQVGDTEQCLNQMSNLSDQINQVYSNTNEIEKIADDTKNVAGEGIVIIGELDQKSKATVDITQNVIQKIEGFENQSRDIGGFVTVLIEIANQTNLLSLNASIEAARAGEAGRGFAVVADEIRKLADQSVRAVNQIETIVSELQKSTRDTVDTAREAENIVESQTEALNRTVSVFDKINQHVNDLVNNLASVAEGIKNIETAKEDTLDAIQNISAVSEETAAASEEVSATALNQTDSVKRLRMAALELANNAKILEEAIRTFKIK